MTMSLQKLQLVMILFNKNRNRNLLEVLSDTTETKRKWPRVIEILNSSYPSFQHSIADPDSYYTAAVFIAVWMVQLVLQLDWDNYITLVHHQLIKVILYFSRHMLLISRFLHISVIWQISVEIQVLGVQRQKFMILVSVLLKQQNIYQNTVWINAEFFYSQFG